MKHLHCHGFIYCLCSCQVIENLLWRLPIFSVSRGRRWWMFCLDFMLIFIALSGINESRCCLNHVWLSTTQKCYFSVLCILFLCILTRSPDRAHLRNLSQSPAASCVAATLHLGVLTSQLASTAAVRQSRETGANTLIWRKRRHVNQIRRVGRQKHKSKLSMCFIIYIFYLFCFFWL